MHILFFTPYFNQPRGNSTTAKRIAHFLQRSGVEVSVYPYLEKDNWYRPSPDLFHILHATRFIKWARENQFTIDRPYIVTMGGTDINVDLQTNMTEEVFSFLDQASFITVFAEDAKVKITRLNPRWTKKTMIIPQGVWVPWNVKEKENNAAPSLLLPAGLRPVKDVLHALPALDRLILEFPTLTFTIIGAKINKDVYQMVQRNARTRPWMSYAGVVPFELMAGWYEKSDIVINTSLSEGQSLAVMEALVIGRPVIARKNGTNENLIVHEKTGWLYQTADDFVQAVRTIMFNPSLRNRVVDQAKEWVMTQFSPEKEANSYVSLYKTLTKTK